MINHVSCICVPTLSFLVVTKIQMNHLVPDLLDLVLSFQELDSLLLNCKLVNKHWYASFHSSISLKQRTENIPMGFRIQKEKRRHQFYWTIYGDRIIYTRKKISFNGRVLEHLDSSDCMFFGYIDKDTFFKLGADWSITLLESKNFQPTFHFNVPEFWNLPPTTSFSKHIYFIYATASMILDFSFEKMGLREIPLEFVVNHCDHHFLIHQGTLYDVNSHKENYEFIRCYSLQNGSFLRKLPFIYLKKSQYLFFKDYLFVFPADQERTMVVHCLITGKLICSMIQNLPLSVIKSKILCIHPTDGRIFVGNTLDAFTLYPIWLQKHVT